MASYKTGSVEKVSGLKRQLLPDTIANLVAEAIAERRFAAGERIVETTLASQFEVSRVPVREALKILYTQGIIDGGGHKGFRVASFSPKMVQSVQEARIDLETRILHDALTNWSAGDVSLARLDEVIAVMEVKARTDDMAGMLHADVDFHRAICEAANNQIFSTLWNAIARHVVIILNLARFKDVDLNIVVRRHRALRDAIASRIGKEIDLADLRKILEEHFQAERAGAQQVTGNAVSPPASPRRRAGKSQS